MLTYQPGDSFDVFCPNRASEVKQLLQRLGLDDQKNHHVQVSLLKNTKKKGQHTPDNYLRGAGTWKNAPAKSEFSAGGQTAQGPSLPEYPTAVPSYVDNRSW